MKYLILSTTLLASPAFALQEPTPGAHDPHICTVNYKADDVLDVQASAGHTVGIRFGEHERIANDGTGHVTVSDEAHLIFAVADGSNIIWLKSKGASGMEAQPILVRTMKADGKPRDYVIQWTAAPLPLPGAPVGTRVASNGPISVSEVPAVQPPNVCYQITYLYPADEIQSKKQAWETAAAKRKAQAAEAALHAQQDLDRNVRYTGQGDASIGPVAPYGSAAVSDDGMTTTLSFPGNLPIPVIYRINPDGTDGATIGVTVEQGGIVRLHEVLTRFRLRQGDRVLCIFNHGYNAVGNNPGTGTTSPNVSREVRE